MFKYRSQSGFNLIEVLLALSVIAIALTALLKILSQNISYTTYIKEKTLGHLVEKDIINKIQLDLIKVTVGQESKHSITMFNQTWNYQLQISKTPIENMQRIYIAISSTNDKEFRNELIAYRYHYE